MLLAGSHDLGLISACEMKGFVILLRRPDQKMPSSGLHWYEVARRQKDALHHDLCDTFD
jgi:hypothetical protein